MPNKKPEENNQNYAAKEFEKIEISEGPESVNSKEESTDSRAVANSEENTKSLKSSKSGRLGSGSPGNSASKRSDNSKTSDTNSGLNKGSGNLNQNTTQQINTAVLTPGTLNDNQKNANPSEEKSKEESNENEKVFKKLEATATAPDDNDDLNKAKAALNEILQESAAMPENKEVAKKGASSLSQKKGAGSLSNLKSSKSLSQAKNGTNSNGNKTNDSNKTQELSQEEQNLQNEFAGSLGDAGKEADQTEDPDAAIISEGKQLGLETGRVNGLGKYIYTDSGGKMQIKNFPFRDEQKQQTFESLEDYTSKIEAPVQQHPNPKFKTAYYQGYNEGYNEGEQLKTDVANREKQKEQNSPQFIEAKMKGIEAGTLSASQNPEDKTKAAQLTQNFEAQLNNADEHQKQIRQKGFDIGYNQGYGGAEMALIQSEKNQITGPEYLEGFEAGKLMGAAIKNKAPISDDMIQKHELLNNEVDEKGKMTLRSKGYNNGYNKGFSDAEQLEIAAESGSTELMKKDIHFNAGLVKGTVFMMLQAASVKKTEKAMMHMLKGNLNINKVLKNSYTIPHDVIKYFKNGKDNSQNEAENKLFETGYIRGYNAIYAETDQKNQSAQQSGSEKKGKSSPGEELGKIGGEASEYREQLALKLARLESQRLSLNPDNNPGKDEMSLKSKIDKINACLQIIQAVVDKKDAVFKKDYYTAYNDAYSAAQIKRTDDAKIREDNDQEGAEAKNKSSFQLGLSAGRGFGIAVFNARKKTVPPDDLNKKMENAFEKAKAKGIDFNNGFTQGYNEKVEIGSGETAAENVSESQKAGLDALEAKKSNKKEGKIYFEKGREEGFEQWYNFAKKTEGEKSESPETKWLRKKENNNFEIIEDIKDDYKELKKEPNLSYQQLAQDFINGFEAGKYKGKIFGENYLEGYRTGLNGGKSNPEGKARYAEGYQEGKQKAQYSNFRDKALAAMGDTTTENRTTQTPKVSENTNNFYQQGYHEHINQWIKVFSIDAGLEIAESLTSVSIDVIESNEETKDKNAAKIKLNTRQKAKYFIKNESNLVEKVLKKIEPVVKDTVKKQMSAKYNVPVDDLPESKVESDFSVALDDYQNGYEAAIQFAKDKTEEEKSDNYNYFKGFLMGYKQGAAALPENVNDSVKSEFLDLPETEDEEDLSNSKYTEGKLRGFQLSVQIKNGMLDANEITAEMAGPEYFSGFQKGSVKGKQDAEGFRKNILNGKNTRMPKLDDIKERENLNGDILSGFDRGYRLAFEKTKAEIRASRVS